MKRTGIAIVLVVLILAAAVATMPWWGGCDLNARRCSTWCNIKNANNDMKAAGCRTRCTIENARCKGREAGNELNQFLKGLGGE